MKQGWEIKRLGEVCEIQGGSTPKRTESLYWDGGTYPWFTIEDIREQGRIITDTKQKVTKVAWDKLRVFPKDTVLLCCTASIGEYAITHIPLTSNQQFNGLMIKDKSYLNPMYLMHYCATLKDKLVMLSGKATIDFVSAEKVRQIPIPIPPIEEQERIVAELDCLSGIIEKKRKQLKELDALAQSIFYQMFGDPITNEKGWEVKTIGDVCKLKSGDSSANNTSEGLLPYIKVGDMNMSENIPYITTSSTLVSREENIKGIFPIGTTIFPKRGGAIFTNKKRLTTVEICCDLNTMGVIPMQEVLPLYIFHFFIQIDFGELCNGAAIPQINNIDIAPLKICVPPLTLQQEFADKIEAIERQKELIKQSITQTEELFNSRMDYYFN